MKEWSLVYRDSIADFEQRGFLLAFCTEQRNEKIILNPCNDRTVMVPNKGTLKYKYLNSEIAAYDPEQTRQNAERIAKWVNSQCGRLNSEVYLKYQNRENFRRLSPSAAHTRAHNGTVAIEEIAQILCKEFKGPFSLTGVGSIASGISDPEDVCDLDILIEGEDEGLMNRISYGLTTDDLRTMIDAAACSRGFFAADFHF